MQAQRAATANTGNRLCNKCRRCWDKRGKDKGAEDKDKTQQQASAMMKAQRVATAKKDKGVADDKRESRTSRSRRYLSGRLEAFESTTFRHFLVEATATEDWRRYLTYGDFTDAVQYVVDKIAWKLKTLSEQVLRSEGYIVLCSFFPLPDELKESISFARSQLYSARTFCEQLLQNLRNPLMPVNWKEVDLVYNAIVDVQARFAKLDEQVKTHASACREKLNGTVKEEPDDARLELMQGQEDSISEEEEPAAKKSKNK